MNFIDKWAIKHTASLQKKQAVIAKANEASYAIILEPVTWAKSTSAKANEASYAIQMQIKRDAKTIIKDEMIKIEKKIFDKDHIEVGDKVIFNVYELNQKCYNSWDGGPRSVISNLKTKLLNPLYATVSEIRVSHGFSDDMIDKFLDNHKSDIIQRMMATGDIFYNYQIWFETVTSNSLTSNSFFKENLGLYKDVFFIIEGSTFQPKWGLNKGCFLKADSDAGKLTAKIWEEELEIKRKIEILDIQKVALELRKKQINDEFKRNAI